MHEANLRDDFAALLDDFAASYTFELVTTFKLILPVLVTLLISTHNAVTIRQR